MHIYVRKYVETSRRLAHRNLPRTYTKQYHSIIIRNTYNLGVYNDDAFLVSTYKNYVLLFFILDLYSPFNNKCYLYLRLKIIL